MRRFAWLPVAVLLALVLASAIATVWARHESRVEFGALTTLRHQRDQLNVEFGRLELEQATWAEPSRVETVARGKLGMIDPPADAIGMIRP
ncbi:MAG TPA: cell division protein FtsL [Rhodanobacteraceae bacterium]|nr:cell division protein FtsL [Rhodanobacteraceae bacterium]